MSYNRRSGGSGGFGGGNFGNAYGPNGNNFSGAGNFGNGGGNFNGNGGGGHFNNYGRNPKMSPWESGVSPGGGMMPNVHPNQMALANDLISKLLSSPNQGGFGGGPNWGPNPGMVRRPESFKNQNRRRPDNRNRKPPPKKDDKKKDSKPEADKNNQSNEANGIKKEKADHEHVDYDGIPTAVLFCHVCQKHMWDGASFEKHVRGRPHELMMTYLDEGYKMQVELMRHQIKAAENQREIDLERMQAQNKGKAKPLFRNYCPMCNINFYGPLTGHRKSDRHRKLKQFLHPECKMCDTLFHTRLEWDDHKLSADHLRKVGEQRRQFNPDLKDDEFELLDVIIIDDNEEDLPIISQAQMLQDQEIKEEVDNQEEQVQVVAQVKPEDNEDENQLEAVDDVDKVEENVIKKDNTVEEENDLKEEENDVKEENDIKKEENGNAKEDASIIKKEKDEKYNPANVVGRELVVKTGGFVCRLCSVFMKNAEEAELHCQTATHYINFTSITKLHAKINNRKRKMKEEKKENEGDEDENKEATADPPGKRSCVDNNIEDIKPVVEVVKQNGTEEPEITNTDDNEAQQDIIEEKQEVSEVQETKLEVPVTEEPKDVSVETNIAETESAEESNSPVGKTTPTRGRGSGRGATGKPIKLQPKYRGPMVVLEVLQGDTYKIAVLVEGQIQRYATTAHISLLKTFCGHAEPPDQEEEKDEPTIASVEEEGANVAIRPDVTETPHGDASPTITSARRSTRFCQTPYHLRDFKLN